MSAQLSALEAERYDRQIRVWGTEAQARIQSSRALICGMNKINVEVVKNIVLAGVNLTIQDSAIASIDDLALNFFLTVDDVGKLIGSSVLTRVKELNSFSSVEYESTPLDSLSDEYFSKFSVILMSGCTEKQAIRIDNLCRNRDTNSSSSVFFWSDVFGEDALFYSDFGANFEYKEDNKSSSATTSSHDTTASSSVEPAKNAIKIIQFPALSEVLSKPWQDIPSRFFPISLTFVKHRLLTKFRETHKRNPFDCQSDIDFMRESLATFENGSAVVEDVDNGNTVNSKLVSAGDIQRLCVIAELTSVMTCSIMGSFLSQEVIKAVSKTGTPAFNVVVFSGEDFVCKAVPI